jgi:hypothetical protein
VPEHYFRNAEQFKKTCDELKLEIIPAVMSFGYSDGILAHDPNLVEGLPCRNLPLRIKNGVAELDSDNPNLVPGDFEKRKGDAFLGWSFQDEPGSGTFADEEAKHGGKTALRIENPPGKEGNRRVSKVLKVHPWTQYHASVWSEQDAKAKLTAGQLLAENVKHCVQIVRKVNPQARLCIWSDMFDPHHNAVDNFYLVNGNLAGSWEGLPKDMTIINWNSGKAKESLPFFASRGHSQVLAGYYDSDPKNIVRWLTAGEGQKVDGAMYTTWQSNFSDLEKFAEAAWGKRK